MTNPNHMIQTYVDAEKIVSLEMYGGAVRDQLILIRDAVHAIRTGAVQEVRVHVQGKDWSLTIEARK